MSEDTQNLPATRQRTEFVLKPRKAGRPVKFTPKKQDLFIDVFVKEANLAKAAEAVGVAPRTVYFWAKNDEDFKAMFTEAKDALYWKLVDIYKQKAVEKKDAAMLEKLLFWLRPNEWSNKVQIDHNVDGEIKHGVFVAPTESKAVEAEYEIIENEVDDTGDK